MTVMGKTYDMDLVKMTQKNLRSGKTRTIRLKDMKDAGMTPDQDYHDHGGQREHFEASPKTGVPKGDKAEFNPDSAHTTHDPDLHVFQFYHDEPGAGAKWLTYPKSEQKVLQQGWHLQQDIVVLGPNMEVNFKDMKENDRIPVRRIAAKKLAGWKAEVKTPQDKPGNQRDLFEWYNPDKDQWLKYNPAEDKQLKTAWLAGKPTVHLTFNGQTYEVNFEQLKQRNLKTGVSRSIRNPIKFGPFRRKSKVANYDNADFFKDMKKKP